MIISNCVINLSTDRPAVFAECFRILRTGGHLGISDILAEDHLSPAQQAARFRIVGTRERIGQHHGRWRDVVLIERRSPARLPAPGQDRPQQPHTEHQAGRAGGHGHRRRPPDRRISRQAPGRRTARMLLATGPVVGTCWAVALISGRAWTWPVPAAVRLSFGAVLLLAVTARAAAATSRRSYRRTRLTATAGPVIVILDAAAVAAVSLAAPTLTAGLGIVAAAGLGRIALTSWTLPRLAVR